MHVVPLLRGRINPQECVRGGVPFCRSYSRQNGKPPNDTYSVRFTNKNPLLNSNGVRAAPQDGIKKDAGPSLYEQLFPDQHVVEVKKQRESEIPRLPIRPDEPRASPFPSQRIRNANKARDAGRSRSALQLQQDMEDEPTRTSVLVLRNASKNLVEEDFKRIIPQGKHLPGWNLDQGDIIRVVPGRDLETGEHTDCYYLLFSSPLSAFTYQGHATRIHNIVAAHTPASVLSAIPPPPGLKIDGMDAHAAIRSFSLIPPTQTIDLRQLNPPLPRVLEQIISCQGYPAITKRKDRSPYEARLTFEGPQLHISAIKHVLVNSAKDRGLAWSGGDDLAPKLTKWEPHGKNTHHLAFETEDSSSPEQAGIQQSKSEATRDADQQKKRTAPLVYIAGFQSERAMQSFVHYWHRRPMDVEKNQRSKQNSIEATDLPPIANVEVLW